MLPWFSASIAHILLCVNTCHYNTEFYKAGQNDVAVMKHVEAMIGIGDNAALNKPELDRQRVDRLLADFCEFLGKHPIE